MKDIIPYVILNPNMKRPFRVALPPVDFWSTKIRRREHFQFLKINHGFFGHVAEISTDSNFPQTPEDLASKMYDGRGHYHTKVDKSTYTHAVCSLWHTIRTKKPNIHLGVSDSNGFAWLQHGDTKHGKSPDHSALVNLTTGTTINYIHGGIFRHYAVTDEMEILFKELNTEDVNLIVVGPAYCKDYISKLVNFTHVPIPTTNALNELDFILKLIESKFDKNKHNVIIGSCALVAYPLCERLIKNNKLNSTFIDVGRALDYYIRKQLKQPWLKGHTVHKWAPVVRKIRNSKNQKTVNRNSI